MSLLRGMDRIPGRQVLILPLRCTVYSFQRKKRKRRRTQATENGDWRSHLFTAFCFDFEQVDLEALLHLAGLLLGCSFFGAQTGDLLGTHSTGSPARWAPGPLHHADLRSPTDAPGCLSDGSLVAFTPLPPLCSPSQELAQSRKTRQHVYLHAVDLQAWVRLSQAWSQRLLPDCSRGRSDSQVKS